MKFSRKFIFLAVILIVVSIISIYFGSVTTVEGATTTLSCQAGTKGTSSTDANGNVTLNCSDAVTTTIPTSTPKTTPTSTPITTTTTPTTPAAASCTGIVCALKISDCTSKAAYSNQTCCATQATKKTACKP